MLIESISGTIPPKTCNICGHISGVSCFSKTQYFKCNSAIMDTSRLFQCPIGLMCNDSLEFCSKTKSPVCETNTQFVLNSSNPEEPKSEEKFKTTTEQISTIVPTKPSFDLGTSQILNDSSLILNKLIVIFLQVNVNVTHP